MPHTPNPDAWKTVQYDKVISINRTQTPEARVQGFMKIVLLENDCTFLKRPENLGTTIKRLTLL